MRLLASVGEGVRDEVAKASTTLGLRDYKKLRLRLEIERQALRLVIEHGYDQVTVEDICSASEISKKTFFNYFPSKIAALVGFRSLPSAEEIVALLEQRQEGGDYFDVVARLMGSRMSLDDDDDVTRLRAEVMRLIPQLFFHGQKELFSAHEVLARAVGEFLTRHPRERILEGLSPEKEAFVASSAAIDIARIQTMLRACGGERREVGDARRLLAAYLDPQGHVRP